MQMGDVKRGPCATHKKASVRVRITCRPQTVSLLHGFAAGRLQRKCARDRRACSHRAKRDGLSSSRLTKKSRAPAEILSRSFSTVASGFRAIRCKRVKTSIAREPCIHAGSQPMCKPATIHEKSPLWNYESPALTIELRPLDRLSATRIWTCVCKGNRAEVAAENEAGDLERCPKRLLRL